MRVYWRGHSGTYGYYCRYGLWRPLGAQIGIKWTTRNPDVVVFQKMYSDEDIDCANYYRGKGCSIVFDINIDLFCHGDPLPVNVLQDDADRAIEMASLANVITTTSPSIERSLKNLFNHVHCVHESIDPAWANVELEYRPLTTLILCAISYKIRDILLIKNVLEKWSSGGRSRRIILISDHVEKFEWSVPTEWTLWSGDSTKYDFLNADLQVSPRDTSVAYNRGHSLTKLGLGMLLGMPAIGSPVSSYVTSPCLIANDDAQWFKALDVCESVDIRKQLGARSRDYVLRTRSPKKNAIQYFNLLKKYL